MALHAKMARTLRGYYRYVRSFYTHVPAFDNDWAFLACSDAVDVAALDPRSASIATSPGCAARTTSTTRKRTAGCSACRCTCGANSRRKGTYFEHANRRRDRQADLGQAESANFVQTLDLHLEHVEQGSARMRMPFRREGHQRHGRDPRRRDREPVRHGVLRRAGLDLRPGPEHRDGVALVQLPAPGEAAARPDRRRDRPQVGRDASCYGEVHVRSGDKLVAHATLNFINLPGEWPNHANPLPPGTE